MHDTDSNLTSSPDFDARLAISRWVVGLLEPLLPVTLRVEADERLQRTLDTHPQFVLGWFSGAITSIAGSLPAEDPWRTLAVTYIDNRGRKHLYPAGHELPLEQTGARTRGRVFGSRRDHTDLIRPIFTDWQADPGLASVSRDIDSASSAIIGAAGHGDWQQTLDLLHLIRTDHHGTAANGAGLFRTLRDALLFVMHRRRTYVTAEDDYPQLVFHTWIALAWDHTQGLPVRLVLAPQDDTIADGEYLRRRLGH